MTKKKSIEKLERIIVDLQRFWKNNSVPNMFIYGPNEDDVEYVINTLFNKEYGDCLLYTSPSPRDVEESRMPSSA